MIEAGDIGGLLLGSNGAIAFVLIWLVSETHSTKKKVEKLSDDFAFHRGRLKSLLERDQK